jgi:hypothetical protein
MCKTTIMFNLRSHELNSTTQKIGKEKVGVCELVLHDAYRGRLAWDMDKYCGLPISTGRALRNRFRNDTAACTAALGAAREL